MQDMRPSGHYDSCLRVYDTQTDSLVAIYPHVPYPVSLTPNPEQRCIYVGCQDVILVYPDTPPGVCDEPAASPPKLPQQTVVRGVLFLAESPSSSPSCLLDVSGRKVMDLASGANDVRELAPGVYFIRQVSGAGRGAARVTKVVVTR